MFVSAWIVKFEVSVTSTALAVDEFKIVANWAAEIVTDIDPPKSSR